MSYGALVFTAVLLIAVHTEAAIMPSYMHVCSRNIPNFGECVKDSVHALRPYLKKGIAELNVPSLEPLEIGDMKILEGGQNGLEANVKNLLVNGASNFEIKRLRVSKDHKNFDFDMDLPQLQGIGKYFLSGHILALPLRGNGPFVGNFTNFSANVKVTMDKIRINDIDRIIVKNFNLKIRPGNGNIQLKNLFNGDKALGDVINDTINENFKTFVSEIIVPIQTALEKKFIQIAAKIMENFTYNELFPEI